MICTYMYPKLAYLTFYKPLVFCLDNSCFVKYFKAHLISIQACGVVITIRLTAKAQGILNKMVFLLKNKLLIQQTEDQRLLIAFICVFICQFTCH